MKCHSCPQQTCQSQDSPAKGHGFNLFGAKKTLKEFKAKALPTVALVGFPNVGKSLLFNVLTGSCVTVSNYPGTTVEVVRGKAVLQDRIVSIIDTPGMYSLLPISEEERVARDLLFKESLNLVIHVVDAKHIGRMLALTFQLIEANLPVILAVNMIDEAEKMGIWVDPKRLESSLSIPVVKIAAALKVGIQTLQTKVATYV